MLLAIKTLIKYKMISNLFIYIIFFLLTFIPFQSSFGQTNDSTKQWELGFDLLWLIDKQPLSFTTAFVRVNNPQKNKAWRLRFGGRLSYIEAPTNSIPSDDRFTEIRSFVALGHEWQKEVAQDVSFYYGMDLGARLNYRRWEIPNTSDPTTRNIKEREWRFESMPFVGFKYKFTNWLAASVESAMLLSYGSKIQNTKVIEDSSSNIVDSYKHYSNNASVSFYPFSLINLSFYLPTK